MNNTSSSFICEVPGCLASVLNGDVIYRTSPKGGPFHGKCGKHIVEESYQHSEDPSEFDT